MNREEAQAALLEARIEELCAQVLDSKEWTVPRFDVLRALTALWRAHRSDDAMAETCRLGRKVTATRDSSRGSH